MCRAMSSCWYQKQDGSVVNRGYIEEVIFSAFTFDVSSAVGVVIFTEIQFAAFNP